MCYILYNADNELYSIIIVLWALHMKSMQSSNMKILRVWGQLKLGQFRLLEIYLRDLILKVAYFLSDCNFVIYLQLFFCKNLILNMDK